jgi:hypothetical protein
MDIEIGSVGIWPSTTSRYGACYKFVMNESQQLACILQLVVMQQLR